jgi:hypothetical protein
MKIAARRRLAVGVVATSSALLAGVLIAPAINAAPNGLRIDPSAVSNTNAAAPITFRTTEADLRFGGTAIFTRIGTSATFEVPIPRQTDGVTADREATVTVDFTDRGDGVGSDGPADAGVYSVTLNANDDPTGEIVTGGSDSCTSCFTVLPGGPLSLSSVAPTSLRPGQSGNVSLIGNNFERGTTIQVLFPNSDFVDGTINPNNPPLDADGEPEDDNITTRTELRRQFVVGAGAQAGVRDVRVLNKDGSSALCEDCFFVAGADLQSSNPTGARNDPNQGLTRITFNGTTIAPNGQPRLEFVGNPGSASRSQLTVEGTNVQRSDTSISADYDLRNAAPGSNAYQPVVEGDGGIVNACQASCRFTVLQDGRAPTLTSLDRSDDAGVQKNLQQGETATFAANGTNFSRGTTLVFNPATGLTVTGSEFVSPERVNITVAAATDAPAGDKDVQARLTDGQTSAVCDNCLTVTPAGSTASPAPSSTSVASPPPSATPTASSSPSAGARENARYAGRPSPVRVLDTRSNRGPRRSGELVLDLSQQITDPDATAVVLNVTVTNATARGFLVAYPNGSAKPGTSNVNFGANQTQANEVVVALPANKRVSLFVDSASAHVIADLVGSFTTSTASDTGRITTRSPVRAFDSRDGNPKVRRGEVIVDLSDQLPTGATDAILNVTVTTPNARGFVTVFPTGTARPNTSNVNFERGQTQANEVVTRVGTGSNAGRVSFFIDSADAALIVDVVGAVTPGTTADTEVFTALANPTRAFDSRNNRGARRSGDVTVSMPSTVPSNATGVVLNVTATNGTRAGFVTVYPSGTSRPGTSNVNFTTNRTQANEVISELGSGRNVTLFVGGANSPAAHLIVDVVGYLTQEGAPAGTASATPVASGSAAPPEEECDPVSEALGQCPEPEASPTGTASPAASPTGTASPAASPTP